MIVITGINFISTSLLGQPKVDQKKSPASLIIKTNPAPLTNKFILDNQEKKLIEDGQNFLQKNDIVGFFQLLNTHNKTYPQVEEILSEIYLQRERQLFYYFYKRSYKESIFHLNNIVALRPYGKYLVNRYEKIAIIKKMINNIPSQTQGNAPNTWLGIILKNQDKALIYQYSFPGTILSFFDIPANLILSQINKKTVSNNQDVIKILAPLQAGNLVVLSFINPKTKLTEGRYYTAISHKPYQPLTILEGKEDKHKLNSLHIYFDVILDTKIYKSITIKNQKVNLYQVTTISKQSPIFKKGVFKNDYLGIIENTITETDYFSKIIHMPYTKNITHSQIKDYIYSVSKNLSLHSVF